VKVIAFNGSPRKDGVSEKGIEIMRGELEREGIATEVIHVGNRIIRGCMDCRQCRKTGTCTVGTCAVDTCATGDRSDPVNECFELIKAADGIILGCPVYYGGIAGTFKSFLDRLFFPGPNLKYKVGATVVSLRRSGGITTYHQLNNYFNLAQMIITPTAYWSVIHGNTAEEVLRDEEGCQLMEIQGRNMAWLIKSLANSHPPPASVSRKFTNFIR
jgi:multimeric flavodoxin WrbA